MEDYQKSRELHNYETNPSLLILRKIECDGILRTIESASYKGGGFIIRYYVSKLSPIGMSFIKGKDLLSRLVIDENMPKINLDGDDDSRV